MFKYTILALLLIATIQQTYFLSPLYPQTAFQGSYYEVRFRVRGLDFPHFNFKGLPDCFKGASDGIISGVSKGPGSYPILVSYSSGSKRGQTQVLIRISPSLSSDSTFEYAVISQTVQTSSGIRISYPTTLVYSVGANINFNLRADGAIAPLLWRYKNLPHGLQGDQTGIIRGVFVNPGYYSFSVECSDSLGISAQTFLTWNIQPRTGLKTSNVVEVRTQHVPLIYDIDQVQKEQIAANEELFKFLEVVDKRKQVVTARKQVVAVATLATNNAQASLDAATKAFNIASADRENARDRLRITENALKAAQQNLNLAITEQGNAQKNLVNARSAVAEALKRFAKAQIDLSAAEDRLVDAKDKMRTAQEKLRTTVTARDAAQNEYKRSFADLEEAKGDLESAKRRKQVADLNVAQARDSLSIVQQARDYSVAALNVADFALKAAEANLNKVLDKLATIRSLYVNAKTEYGQAQWNFEIALNKLYVAQARKQTADRASAIALAQGSYSDHNTGFSSSIIGSSSSIKSGSAVAVETVSFVGCETNTYPPISGTVRVSQKLSNGYRVASGQQIVFGGCTQKTDCQVGDTIAYRGFLVNGVVNANRIERVLLS